MHRWATAGRRGAEGPWDPKGGQAKDGHSEAGEAEAKNNAMREWETSHAAEGAEPKAGEARSLDPPKSLRERGTHNSWLKEQETGNRRRDGNHQHTPSVTQVRDKGWDQRNEQETERKQTG